MKPTSVYAVAAASAVSALLISSANAGGHRNGPGMSSSSMSAPSYSTGRSSLGGSSFVVPSTATSTNNVSTSATTATTIHPISQVPQPLPIKAPPLINPAASLFTTSSTSTTSGSNTVSPKQVSSSLSTTAAPSTDSDRIVRARRSVDGSDRERILHRNALDDRGTKVIFTPPPTIVGVPSAVSGTGNIAGANAADRTFSGSILNSGLSSQSIGGTSANSEPWIRITPLQYAAPTVEAPTSSATKR